MMTKFNLNVCVLAFALISNTAFSAVEGLSYKSFRANGIFATNSVGNSLSAGLSWNPSYAINSKFDVRGIVGLAPLKGADDETFMMSEYGVLAAYEVAPAWELELGAGMQSWSGQDTSPMMSANIIKTLSAPYMGVVDGFFAGYSMVTHEEATSEFKVGVTFSFGGKN